ncbi:protein FAM83F-like [Heterodontus francisci]|uniref:protein FAM83F-like n=1 Tax=Heterodontus francisci TaxID=7792 RepID=UPI00355C91A8
MAGSQLECLEDNHINVKINDKNAGFYYCEDQRLALEKLLKTGETDFYKLLKEKQVKEFISSKELEKISKNYDKYQVEGKNTSKGKKVEGESHSTYWPEQSDIPIPELDLGWTEHVVYRGITRATVHMHPPKNNDPFIKEIVRKVIQEARKVIGMVMDEFTDRNIFEDLIEACSRRKLPVYIVLNEGNLKYFLEMCRKMELNDLMIRYLRVRSITGPGLYLESGYVKGALNQKFMIVDGDKVLCGSYSFTWSCARLHRSTLTVYTGQILENFDTEFRELYANSDMVNLHEHLNIKPGLVAPMTWVASSLIPPRSDDLKRKFNNPKYLLVSEGMRRAISENQLLPPNEDKVEESSVKFRERKGTMKDSKKEDHSKGNQAVQEWLLKNDVRGLEEPEPLEDLVPISEMPRINNRKNSRVKKLSFSWSASKKVKVPQSPDGDSRVSLRSSVTVETKDAASKKNVKAKLKDSAKSGKQPTEAENSTDMNTGKDSTAVLEQKISTTLSKSKKEKCVLS